MVRCLQDMLTLLRICSADSRQWCCRGADGLPIEAIKQQIASAVDIIIHLSRLRDKSRKTMAITEVVGIKNGEIELNPLYEFKEDENSTMDKVSGRLVRTGNPLKNDYKLKLSGIKTAI